MAAIGVTARGAQAGVVVGEIVVISVVTERVIDGEIIMIVGEKMMTITTIIDHTKATKMIERRGEDIGIIEVEVVVVLEVDRNQERRIRTRPRHHPVDAVGDTLDVRERVIKDGVVVEVARIARTAKDEVDSGSADAVRESMAKGRIIIGIGTRMLTRKWITLMKRTTTERERRDAIDRSEMGMEERARKRSERVCSGPLISY